jgi:allantoinase
MMKISSNRCFTDGKLKPATLEISEGIIAAVHPGIHADALFYGDAVIMPGCIDAHVHINEPGRTEWEGFETATMAALAGGTTSLVDMPLNSSPVTVSVKDLEAKLEAAKGKLNCNTGFYGGVIPGNQHELEGLAKAGVLGFKCFLVHSGIDDFPNVSREDLELAMPVLDKFGLPLLAHCEWIDKEASSPLKSNPTSYQAYLASRPKKWENDAVALMIELSEKYNCPVHIVHVSSAEALVLIQKAKEKGLKITAETCPQYLLFEAETIPDGNTLYKCAPPIREKENNRQLKKALETGILDFIATDHSPAPPEIKELGSGNLEKAWGGIAGIQFLLTASWTALGPKMPLEKFIPLLTENPARFLKLDHKKGKIKAGYDADLVVWNPEEQFVTKTEDLLFRHKISPYADIQLSGRVLCTYMAGKAVFQQQKITLTHQGTWLRRV